MTPGTLPLLTPARWLRLVAILPRCRRARAGTGALRCRGAAPRWDGAGVEQGRPGWPSGGSWL